jgi:drug/metabolite transporter (DMT)-like permease
LKIQIGRLVVLNPKTKAGILSAFTSAFFLGLAPVFGKLAINSGISPLATVALRTGLAAGFLLLVVVIFYRNYLYIFPIGLIGCMIAGATNGIGSILYYLALERLDASLGQLLYSLYPFFVAVWLILDHQPPSRLTFFRIGLATLSVLLLTRNPEQPPDPMGILLMLGAAVLYALHLPINQRVLHEVPAPTVALYTLLSMSLVVWPAFLIFDRNLPENGTSWLPIHALAFVTLSSRVALFLGIKKIGGMQTSLLGLAELLITVVFSHLWLGESLTLPQWIGAFSLGLSLTLVMYENPLPNPPSGRTGWLSWIRSPDLPREVFGPYE